MLKFHIVIIREMFFTIGNFRKRFYSEFAINQQNNDVRGNVGKLAIISSAEEGAIIGPQLVILRITHPVVSGILLYSSLKQRFVKAQIDSFKYGSVIFGIKIKVIEGQVRV